MRKPKPTILICGIPIDKKFIKLSVNSAALSMAMQETTWIKRTPESELLYNRVVEAVNACKDQDNVPFSVNGEEWLGTVAFDDESKDDEFIFQLTVT